MIRRRDLKIDQAPLMLHSDDDDDNDDDDGNGVEAEMTLRKRESPRLDQQPLMEEDEMTREGFISPPCQPQVVLPSSASASPSQPSTSIPFDFSEQIVLRSFPWFLWTICVAIALLPWLLLFVFPSSNGLSAFCSLFGVVALCLAALCDWVTVTLDPVSAMFVLTKNSLFRIARRKHIDERFALSDIRRVQVIWLGEREMIRSMRASRNPPCCHSHKSSIQASTILMLTISGSSVFQVHNRSLISRNVPLQEDLSYSDITAAEGGHLNITIREVQDLLGCEGIAVNELHDWARIISNALHLDYETVSPPLED